MVMEMMVKIMVIGMMVKIMMTIMSVKYDCHQSIIGFMIIMHLRNKEDNERY